MADKSSVGRSRMSDRRSMFRAIIRAFFRRSSTAFSALRLYLAEKATACSSSLGMSFWRDCASDARSGRAELKPDRWSVDAIIAAVDRAESDCRDR